MAMRGPEGIRPSSFMLGLGVFRFRCSRLVGSGLGVRIIIVLRGVSIFNRSTCRLVSRFFFGSIEHPIARGKARKTPSSPSPIPEAIKRYHQNGCTRPGSSLL